MSQIPTHDSTPEPTNGVLPTELFAQAPATAVVPEIASADAVGDDEHGSFVPPTPESLQETGLSEALVTGLVLKVLHQRGAMRGDEIADVVALPFTLIDDLLLNAQQRHLIEVLRAHGHGRIGYTYSLTSEGRERAEAAFRTSRYVGAAPVPLEAFREVVAAQSVRDVEVRRDALEGAFSDLVLPPGMIDALGPAVNSGGSIFLHGAPGNGKTATAERVGTLTSSTIYMPQALLIHGHIMVLYDPIYHAAVETEDRGDEWRSARVSGPKAGRACAILRFTRKDRKRFRRDF